MRMRLVDRPEGTSSWSGSDPVVRLISEGPEYAQSARGIRLVARSHLHHTKRGYRLVGERREPRPRWARTSGARTLTRCSAKSFSAISRRRGQGAKLGYNNPIIAH